LDCRHRRDRCCLVRRMIRGTVLPAGDATTGGNPEHRRWRRCRGQADRRQRPAVRWQTMQTVEPLIAIRPSTAGRLPGVAKSGSLAPDGRSLRLSSVPNVKFHYALPFTDGRRVGLIAQKINSVQSGRPPWGLCRQASMFASVHAVSDRRLKIVFNGAGAHSCWNLPRLDVQKPWRPPGVAHGGRFPSTQVATTSS